SLSSPLRLRSRYSSAPLPAYKGRRPPSNPSHPPGAMPPMSLSRRHLLLVVAGLAAASSAGCTITAEIPQIQARDLRFTGIDPAGLTFQVDFIAYNTNSFTLDLHDLRARMIIEGNDIGAGVS